MAFAYCPKCGKSFRYAASAKGQPPWLREFARSVGRGEKPVLLCYACWLVPEVGDPVEILEPPYEPNELTLGVEGVVREVQPQEEGELYVVAGTDPSTGALWRHSFRAHQLRAALRQSLGTVSLSLRTEDDAYQL